MLCNQFVTTISATTIYISINWIKLFVDMEQNFIPGQYIQTGPHEAELLYLQNEHRSQAIWNGQVIGKTLQWL